MSRLIIQNPRNWGQVIFCLWSTFFFFFEFLYGQHVGKIYLSTVNFFDLVQFWKLFFFFASSLCLLHLFFFPLLLFFVLLRIDNDHIHIFLLNSFLRWNHLVIERWTLTSFVLLQSVHINWRPLMGGNRLPPLLLSILNRKVIVSYQWKNWQGYELLWLLEHLPSDWFFLSYVCKNVIWLISGTFYRRN